MTITVPELNPNVFSFDSLEGIIVVVALAFLVWCIARKFIKFVWWSIGLIFFIQIMYVLGKSPVNDIIPIGNIFKYDVFSAIAQLCVGTKFSEGLLAFGNWLSNLMYVAGAKFVELWNGTATAREHMVESVKGPIEEIGNTTTPVSSILPTLFHWW